VVWIHKPKPSPESSESAETCGESTQHATGRRQPPTLSPRNPVHIRRNLKTLDAGNPAQPRLSAAAWWSLALASPRLAGWSTTRTPRPRRRSSTSCRRRTRSRCPWTPARPRRGPVMLHRMPPLLRPNHHLKVSEPLSPLSHHASRCAILRFLRLDLSLVSTDLWCWRA
jgi:hypothetical protein